MNSLDIESHGNIANRLYDISNQIPNFIQYPIPDIVPYPIQELVPYPQTNSNIVVVPSTSVVDPSTSVIEPSTSVIQPSTSVVPNPANANETPDVVDNKCNCNCNCNYYRILDIICFILYILFIILIIVIIGFPLLMILLPAREEYTFKQVDISISQISTSTFLFYRNAEALNNLTSNIKIVNEDLGNNNYKVYYTINKYCPDIEICDCSFMFYVNGVENIQRSLLAYEYNYYEHTFLGTQTMCTENPDDVEKPLSEISVIGTTIYIIYAIIISIIITIIICCCCDCRPIYY